MALNPRAKTRFRAAARRPDTENKTPPISPTSVQLQEPEDAYLTGTSRSLQRRLLGLNIEGNLGKKHPASVPGQHATGSYTQVQAGDALPKASGQH